jgi:hypothetical protein
MQKGRGRRREAVQRLQSKSNPAVIAGTFAKHESILGPGKRKMRKV